MITHIYRVGCKNPLLYKVCPIAKYVDKISHHHSLARARTHTHTHTHTYIYIYIYIYIALAKIMEHQWKIEIMIKLIYLKVKNSEVNINNNNQYVVCPFVLITAFIRFCIQLTKLLQVIGSIFCHSSWSLASNSFFDEHLCILTLFPKWDHKVSMGFRSGDLGATSSL